MAVGRLEGRADGVPFHVEASGPRVTMQFPMSWSAGRALWRVRRTAAMRTPRPLDLEVVVRLGSIPVASRRL